MDGSTATVIIILAFFALLGFETWVDRNKGTSYYDEDDDE